MITDTTPIRLSYQHVEDALHATIGLIMQLEKGSFTRMNLFNELMLLYSRAATAQAQLDVIEASRRKVQAVLDQKVSAVDAPTP